MKFRNSEAGMKYVLEPMLFAFESNMSEQELTDYLDELLILDNWWDRHSENMYVSSTTSDVLWENRYYPIADTLKPLIEKYSINFIQYGDVNKIIDKMLNKTKKIESLYDEMCGVTNQTLKEEIQTMPHIKRSDELNEEFMKLLGNVFLASVNGGYNEKSFVVITKGISDWVCVEYEYEEIEGDEEKWALVEKKGVQEVNCKGSLSDFLNDKKTPFLLWKTAERKDDIDLGIRVSILQWKGERYISRIYDDYDFKIQDSFYDDYCNGHYYSKDQEIRSAIQAVMEAVTDQKLRKMHAIRTGKHGNDPQLRKNGYDAQRRDITTSIKLAYWKKGGEYKIANMKEHDIVECAWEQ